MCRQKQKEEEEEAELKKRVRAREPPAHVYLPLYEEMKERREQRSRFNRENAIATLVATQKPFSFDERDERKRILKAGPHTLFSVHGIPMQDSFH